MSIIVFERPLMKLKMLTAFPLTLAFAGGSAHAITDFVDTAQVVSSTPIIERVAEQRQECDNVPPPRRSSSLLGPIVGGLLGGLLGHQVGQGRGQTAATIAGAAGGAVAGSAYGNRNSAPAAQQCRTVESTREIVNGYDVVYRYNDRDVKVALPYDPGSTIKIGVGVVLDERAASATPTQERGTERYSDRGERRSDRYPDRNAQRNPELNADRAAERYSDRGLQSDAEASPAAAANSTYNYRY